MAKARSSSMQHNADAMHYGAIPITMFPDGDPDGGDIQLPVWVNSESAWYMLTLIGGGGMDVSVSLSEGTVEVFYSDIRVYGSFDSDAIVLRTEEIAYEMDAVLLKTVPITFTADAVLA